MISDKKKHAAQIIKRLKKEYPDAHCALIHTNAFELLIATILSAQCTDVRVNIVTADLFRKYRSPQDYLNVGKVLRLSPWKLFIRILLPATIPYMFTGFRLSLGIAWLVIVAAEMLSGKNGIGAFVNNQYQSGTYGPMIAAVIVIGVVGFMLDRLMNLVEKNSMLLLSLPSRLGRMIGRLRAAGVRPSIEAATSRILPEATLLTKESVDVAT